MLGYDFEIVYKKDKENIVANALSRKDEKDEALLCALSRKLGDRSQRKV